MNKIPACFLTFIIASLLLGCSHKEKYTSWEQYKGFDENIHYSALAQVDTANVKQLQVAWTYHTRDADSANHSQIQCNPIMIDGVMYGTTPKMKLFAIDA